MVDHASSYSYSYFIMGATNEQTVAAKHAYERVMREYGHNMESYHGNNIRFDSEDFTTSCKGAQQTYSYSGVGRHHQNRIAKNMNKCLTHSARTVLLHTKRKWSAVINTILWLFAYRAVVERHNKLDLNANGLSPLEQLLGHREEIMAGNFHTWDCPIFVLDSRSQDGTGIEPPKRDPKARASIYLGHSPFHAGNVALVLDLQTGHVSPQCHVVFDDEFSTVPYLQSSEPPPNWIDLVQNHTE
eukprot:5587614-Ditylum_brightwellii.AAC.1